MQEIHVRDHERKHALVCSGTKSVDESGAHERPVGTRGGHPDICDQCYDTAHYHCWSSPENVRAGNDNKIGITQSDDHDSSLILVSCMFHEQERTFKTYEK